MIINRHNYEEFFLLYVDNELDADGRVAVETFASQNPDLARELELLQQATLTDDDITFRQKDLLYKDHTCISIDNYQEYFLLFTDCELSEQQAGEVENFVLKHPELQNEFTLLRRTRLAPEVIAFAGKQKLYRKEKKVRRIIPVAFIRMGAAAAIAGIAYISFVIVHPVNSIPNKDVATSQKPAQKRLETSGSNAPKKPVTESADAVSEPAAQIETKAKIVLKNSGSKQKDVIQKLVRSKTNEESVAAKDPKPENKIQIAEPPVAQQEIQAKKPDFAEVAPQLSRLDKDKPDLFDRAEKNNSMVSQPIAREDKPLATHAVYLETDDVEEEKSIYIGSAEINKNKVTGLFKKAAGLFKKRMRGNNE